MPARSGVEVRLATAADAEPVASFLPAAFAHDPLHRSLFHTPGPGVESDVDPARHAREVHVLRVARLRAGVRRHHQQASDRPEYTLVALLDGHVVGMAVWKAPKGTPSEPPEGPLDVLDVPDTTPPGFWNAAVDASINEALVARSRELFGNDDAAACWHLRALAVDAAAQGKGAGGALVAWGTSRADAEGVQCYVESSDAGLAVYRRAAFVDAAAWIEFTYGGRRLPMVRAAKGA